MAKRDVDLREPETEPSFWAVALAVSLAFNAVILVGVAPGTLWPSGNATVAPVEQRVAMSLPPPERETRPETRIASLPIAPEPEPVLPVVESAATVAPEPPVPAPASTAVRAKPKPRPAKLIPSTAPRQPDPLPPEPMAEPVAIPVASPAEPAPTPVVAVAPPPPAPAPEPAREDDFLPPEMRHRGQLALGPFRMTVPSWRPLPAAMTR